jgi:hypothetical protein
MSVTPIRARACLYVLSETVDVELTASAREHLALAAQQHGLPSLSALVQALAVSAAYPRHPRDAAERAHLTYARWLVVVALVATGYSDLGVHLDRARAALTPSAADSAG